MSNEENQSESAKLLHNLGTDASDVAQGKINMKRFGHYDAGDKVFLHYALLRKDESNFWKQFAPDEEDFSIGINGRGRMHAIQGMQVERGNVSNIQPDKPSLSDHILNRDKVKEYEQWKKENEIE
jgi:hypothetical protein